MNDRLNHLNEKYSDLEAIKPGKARLMSDDMDLILAGISHWRTPVSIREKFSLSDEARISLAENARALGISSILVLSTCNRTEIYAENSRPSDLIRILCQSTKGDSHDFNSYGFIKHSQDAKNHLFRVTAGLDSQVSGDTQVTSQVRDSLLFSLNHQIIRTPLHRMTQSAISTAKKIRSSIPTGQGSPSLSKTAVEMVMKSPGIMPDPCFLVIGLGKMGQLVINSLMDKVKAANITVINRSIEKAFGLYGKKGVRISGFESIELEIQKADIVIVSASAGQALVRDEHLEQIEGNKIIVDLGVPRNVDISAGKKKGIQLIDIDMVIQTEKYFRDENMILAETLIHAGLDEFSKWHHRWKYAQDIKSQLFDSIFSNNLEDPVKCGKSRFIEGLAGKYIRHMQAMK